MRREDFKEITKKHIETAKKLVESKGDCDFVDCEDCPFDDDNLVGDKNCGAYSTTDTDPVGTDEALLKSAQEFLLLAEKNIDKKIVGIDFKEKDNVNSPNHYKLEGLDIESIDVIFAVIRSINNGVIADCVGNILKYVMRAEKKNGLEDYKKARKYLDWCIEEKKKNDIH